MGIIGKGFSLMDKGWGRASEFLSPVTRAVNRQGNAWGNQLAKEYLPKNWQSMGRHGGAVLGSALLGGAVNAAMALPDSDRSVLSSFAAGAAMGGLGRASALRKFDKSQFFASGWNKMNRWRGSQAIIARSQTARSALRGVASFNRSVNKRMVGGLAAYGTGAWMIGGSKQRIHSTKFHHGEQQLQNDPRRRGMY